jgi:hypothetical protein
LPFIPGEALDFHVREDGGAVVFEGILDNLAQLRFLARQERLGPLQERHAHAEGRKELREFAADRTSAKDDDAGRQGGKAHRFDAGDRLRLGEAFDRGHFGPGTRGDHDLAAPQRPPIDADAVLVLKRGCPTKEANAFCLVTVRRRSRPRLANDRFFAG